MPLAPGTNRIRERAAAASGPLYNPCGECTAPVVVDKGTCAGCKISVYCDVECQKANWTREHKKLCKVFKAGGAFTNKELDDLASTTDLCAVLQSASFEPYRKHFLEGTAKEHYFDVCVTKDTFSGKPVLFGAGMMPRPRSESFLDGAQIEAESNPHMKRTMEDPAFLPLTIYIHSGKAFKLLTFIATVDYPTEMEKDDLWRGTLQLALGAL